MFSGCKKYNTNSGTAAQKLIINKITPILNGHFKRFGVDAVNVFAATSNNFE